MPDYEAIINGGKDSVDPITQITIHTAMHDYTYLPEDIQTVVVRPMSAKERTDEPK